MVNNVVNKSAILSHVVLLTSMFHGAMFYDVDGVGLNWHALCSFEMGIKKVLGLARLFS